MKVEAIHHKHIEVELDTFTIREIVVTQFCNIFNLPRDAYIKDDKLVEDVAKWGGSHSWFEEKIIRDVTEEDVAAIKILDKLKQKL